MKPLKIIAYFCMPYLLLILIWINQDQLNKAALTYQLPPLSFMRISMGIALAANAYCALRLKFDHKLQLIISLIHTVIFAALMIYMHTASVSDILIALSNQETLIAASLGIWLTALITAVKSKDFVSIDNK